MHEYIVHWYDYDEIKKTEEWHIFASSIDEATEAAFKVYDGKPPAPLLYLEEVIK